MIKNYKLFKESNSNLNLDAELTEFLDDLWECQSYYMDLDMDQFSSSYSRTAQEGRKDNNGEPFDPTEDYGLVSEWMKEHGWPDERIENLFLKMPGINLKIYDGNKCTCAPIDYYLYELTDETYPLQGYTWDIDEDNEDDLNEDDVFIKFGYGWHKTKYGRLCVEQNFGTVEKFLNYAMHRSVNSLVDAIATEKVGDIIELKNRIKDCIVILDKSHNEIYIDTQDMKVVCDSVQDSEDDWVQQSQKEFDNSIVSICKSTVSQPVKVVSPGNLKVLFQ